MQRQNSLLRNTAYIAVAEIAKPLVAFALVILISRRLGPAGVGAYTVILTFALLIEQFATAGLCSVFVRGIAMDTTQLSYYSSGAVGVSIVATLIFTPITLVVLRILHYPPEVDRGIHWLLYTLVVAIIQQYVLSICEGLQRMRLRSLISFLDTAGRVVVGIAMIALGRGVIGIIQGMVITRILTTALGVVLLGPEVYASSHLRNALKWCPGLFRAGLPFLLTTITSTAFWSVNTLMLSKMGLLEGVGIYTAASRLSDVLRGMIYSYLIALLPLMSASFVESVSALRRQCDDSLKYMIILSLPISTGVSVLAPSIIRVIYGHKFDAAVSVLSVLGWTVSLFSISTVFARVLIASHNQIPDLYCNAIALSVNVVANFIFIPRYGPVGAGVAGLVSLITFFVLEYIYVTRLLFRPVMGASFLRAGGSCLVMALVLEKVASLPLFVTIPLGALVYAGSLLCLGTFSSSELHQMRGTFIPGVKQRRALAFARSQAAANEPKS